MSFAPFIKIQHLRYAIPNQKMLFNELSLNFGFEKTGLIGKNGVGKSTLIRLILGQLIADSGTIDTKGTLAYFPQNHVVEPNQTVADLLNLADKLDALNHIRTGSSDPQDYAILDDDWELENRIKQQLANFGLAHIESSRLVDTLSGGEKTRILLASQFLKNPDFLILDEPTNNLDSTSRQFLYKAVSGWKGGMLIVSHDRNLLNLMDRIVELTSLGANIYGGNYDDFVVQKDLLNAANQRELFDAKKVLAKTQAEIQQRQQRREQKNSYGRQLCKTGKVDKLTANSWRDRSEKTQSRHSKINETLLKNAEEDLQTARAKIEINYAIDVELPQTFVPNGKVVVDIEDLVFRYHPEKLLIKNFNLKLIGPERIALIGDNGSGKTTLIKLILGKLKPDAGRIYIGVEQVNYFDQNVNLLNPEISVLENFKQFNPGINETDARFYLADFLFRNTAALKLAKDLSGGEKLRATLACILMSQRPPQLLILDEPTNHLDFESITSIETTLKNYQGAMIVVSHDERFLRNAGAKKTVKV